VYSNHFVMCVLVDGQPIQELANGVVSMPFNTEYALRFRNKNNRRAVVKIYIDGENVSGDGYVVRAQDYVDIKRHHDIDRSFKFVSLDSPDAVEHGKNGPNADKVKGTIEARFYLEKERPQPVIVDHHHHHHHDWYRPIVPTPMPRPYPYQPPYWYGTTCNASPAGETPNLRKSVMRGPGGSSAGLCSLGGPSMNATVSMNAAPDSNTLGFSGVEESCRSPDVLKDGCTVEGGTTGQSFHTVYIDLEETYTSLKLFLQGHEAEVQTAAPKKTRKTNKDNRVDDLEAENEELRRKLAELENEKLKAKLAETEKPKTKAKPRVTKKAKPKSE
jgi:hypothetical protein